MRERYAGTEFGTEAHFLVDKSKIDIVVTRCDFAWFGTICTFYLALRRNSWAACQRSTAWSRGELSHAWAIVHLDGTADRQLGLHVA